MNTSDRGGRGNAHHLPRSRDSTTAAMHSSHCDDDENNENCLSSPDASSATGRSSGSPAEIIIHEGAEGASNNNNDCLRPPRGPQHEFFYPPSHAGRSTLMTHRRKQGRRDATPEIDSRGINHQYYYGLGFISVGRSRRRTTSSSWGRMLLLAVCMQHFIPSSRGFEIYSLPDNYGTETAFEFHDRQTEEEDNEDIITQFYEGGHHKKESEPSSLGTTAGNSASFGHEKENNNDDGSSSGQQRKGLTLGSVQTYSAASDFANSNNSNSNNNDYSIPSASNHNCPPTTCANVGLYDLLPIYPNCKEYILCQHSHLTLEFECPTGMRFDNSKKRCETEEEAECACVTEDDEGRGGNTEDDASRAQDVAASETTVDIIEDAGTATAGTIDTDSGSTTNGTPPQRQSVVDDEANAICDSVERSQLLPLASANCEEYVSCLDGRVVRRQACAEGLLFDAGMQGCNWNYAVDCPEYEGAENEPSTSGGGIGGTTGSFNIGNIIFSNTEDDDDDDDDDVIVVSPEDSNTIATFQKSIVQLAREESIQVCAAQSNSFAPLQTTGCKYYVYCGANGDVANMQQCGENLAFDIAILGCNWENMVECPTMSPTGSPSDGPSERPTNGPTRRPTARPTQRATRRPTRRPTGEPTNQPTDRPTDQPTPQPTSRPTQRPTPEVTPRPIADSIPVLTLLSARPTPPPTKATPRPTNRPTSAAPPPDIYQWLQNHRRQLNQNVFQSYTRDGVRYRSYWFQYQDFYQALEAMSGGGRSGSGDSITGLEKHLFYVGDEPHEWEYGLVNIAAFLAHAMTESITNDACDEYHWEKNTDGDSASPIGGGTSNHYAISNACGQNGMNYQEFTCPAGEEHMQCNADRNMILQATTSSVYPNAPPPLSCRPRATGDSYTGYWDVGQGKEQTFFPYENAFGRTDVEGCCYWGRGAIHSTGVCNLGKINYYLGKKAADEGRESRYPTTDFCLFPEAICAAPESREMRWITSLFEWTERVQSYDDMQGWNYKRKLKEFVDYGLTDFEFLEATSGILAKGCHDPPCEGSGPKANGGWGSGDVHMAEERVENFKTILIALEAGGEEALLRALIKYFTDRTDIMNSQILRSQTPQGQLYPSYRYQLPDFLASLTHISEPGIGGLKFYTGESRVPEGVRYGIVNAVMFLAQAYKEAIQYDACDENNWQLVNDRFPLSNSCGQLGMSYQDMHCREDEAYMECPVNRESELFALTSALWFQAPAPFKCGPRSKYPTTGFWDYDAGRENNDDAYANARGRVDVEGCCWWGRGIIQTRGTCNYGKLNYHLGKRAHDEGRPALYPQIDFCEFPQGVCSSDETYGGELQWMVGFFEWIDRIQTYDVDGWNYIEKLKEFTDGGYKDFSFVDAVSGILNIGCHDPPCMGFGDSVVQPHNKRDRNDTFQRFLNQLQVARNFRPPPKPTPMPSPQPTDNPTPGVPTTDMPTVLDPPTDSPTLTHSPTGLQGRPPEEAVQEMEDKVEASKARFAELLLMSEHPSGELWPSYLYTWEGFQKALKKMTTGVGPGEKNFFYIGDGYSIKSLEYGLVNIAAFLAEGITKSIYYDACDENSWEMVNFRYPIANSCGQEGQSYQEDVCDEAEAGMECEVDTEMEIHGVTRARWVGAPPPLYCGDRSAGYWDHITGFEENNPPFKNALGRSDIKGCCWWGRGVLQVKGVCTYGKLNHWLGAKAASDDRPSIYPDIDFCKNPGVICSDPKRSHELRWVTGMFHWVQSVQRSRNFDFFPTLKAFVDQGDYTDGSFIGMVNAMLGGNANDISRRTKTFFYAMRAFNLIPLETNSTGTPVHTYCGVDFNDAGSKCSPCESNFDCTGLELCYADVVACDRPPTMDPTPAPVGLAAGMEEFGLPDNLTVAGSTASSASTNGLASNGDNAQTAGTMVMNGLALTTNYCGESWGDAAAKCSYPCPSGTNIECAPGHSCYGDINTCSNSNSDVIIAQTSVAMMMNGLALTTNYCGESWGDAAAKCSYSCPSGADIECAPGHSCYGDINTCSNSNSDGKSHAGISSNNNDNAILSTTKYCGVDWSDAHSKCSSTCSGGMDSECPTNLKCFGDIRC